MARAASGHAGRGDATDPPAASAAAGWRPDRTPRDAARGNPAPWPRYPAAMRHHHAHDTPHPHSHSHGPAHGYGHDHDGSHAALQDRGLRGAIALTLAFAAVEAVGGWWSGSLALMADAGHMVSDSAALLFAWIAARIARIPPDHRLSYGYRRAEVIAALLNALLMLGIVAALVAGAWHRFAEPRAVHGASVMGIAALGLIVNLLVLRSLHGADHGALNTRGAVLHVLGDLLGSVAALAAGAVVWATGWTPIDPLLTLLIAALILVSAFRLLRDVLHVLMEAVPKGLDVTELRAAMLSVPGVTGLHDLHVWSLAGDRRLLSAHVGIADASDWAETLAGLQRLLRDRYGIGHSTLQPEPPEYRRLLDREQCDRCDTPPLDDHRH